MPRDFRASENTKKARAKREYALERRELGQPSTPHVSASGPISAPIKARDSGDDALIESFLKKPEGRVTKSKTPITDLVRRMLSRKCRATEIVAAVGALELATVEATIASISALQKIEHKRKSDRDRQQQKRRKMSRDTVESPLTESLSSPGLSIQEEVSKSDSAVVARQIEKPAKPDKGITLPDDWAPTDSHYGKGAMLGFSREAVDGFAEKMRNWAIANAHRPVAKKAGVRGWNAAFSNWLDDKSQRNGGRNGATTRGHGSQGGGDHVASAAYRRFSDGGRNGSTPSSGGPVQSPNGNHVNGFGSRDSGQSSFDLDLKPGP